jgi:DNA gyrase subunit B
MKAFVDDNYTHLESDRDKIRLKSRMYISASDKLAAKAIVQEILFNCIDECKSPRSPGDRIDIIYDERIDTIEIADNGRGIPLDLLEKVLTSLNSGSNIDSSNKADLKTNILGRNGVGTLAMTALGEVTEVISYRGGTENKFKRLLFNEGIKVDEEDGNCDPSKHGLTVRFKPSKILGKSTQIVWSQIHTELVNFQFMNDSRIKITSIYINNNGQSTKDDYKAQSFENILTFRNNKDSLISNKVCLNIRDDNIIEEIGGKKIKRFISMKVAFAYTNLTTPYIDSFSNGNNTIENGSHLDGAIEGLCRYFQQATKNIITERDKLDIKWDDVKTGLSIAVTLDTNMEEIYTSQTKYKILNEDLEKIIKEKVITALNEYFNKNPNQLKEITNIVKINARARKESDKARSSIIKETITNWSAYKMDNYDPCTNKGKDYKELYINEGISAKGSLKLSRDPRFQALFAIGGVSANVFKMTLDQIVGPNGNKEFNDLIKVLGCNVGAKFDINKLQFNKIIIASDADKNRCSRKTSLAA